MTEEVNADEVTTTSTTMKTETVDESSNADDDKPSMQAPLKPKKPSSAYQMFILENIERLRGDPRGFMKAGSEDWKTRQDKSSYEAKYLAAKAKYDEEMKAYKEKMKEFIEKGGVVSKKRMKVPLHGDVPLARVKKICKLDTDIKAISSKGYSIIAKASTLFVASLASRTYETQVRPRGTKTIHLKDLASCIHRDRKFRMLDSDFALPDLTKRKKSKISEKETKPIESYPGTQKISSFFSSSN